MEGIAVETQKKELRIVLLGRTGLGRSSTGNTILGENVFTASHGSSSETYECKSAIRERFSYRMTVIDTPGFFDTKMSKETLRKEILRSMILCSPGPHAFMIVFRVDRITEREQEVVKYMNDLFGEEALRYSIIVFTQGDKLDPNETICDFVEDNKELRSFFDKCGGGCHVIDNKYWNQSQDRYRNNTVQIDNIIRSIENMMMRNGGGCYTNEILQSVQETNQELDQEKRRPENPVQLVITQTKHKAVWFLLWLKSLGLSLWRMWFR